jgi:hypothetical protein
VDKIHRRFLWDFEETAAGGESKVCCIAKLAPCRLELCLQEPVYPPHCKLFCWLLLQNRIWCEDMLQRRGCPNEYFCPLCARKLESSV